MVLTSASHDRSQAPTQPSQTTAQMESRSGPRCCCAQTHAQIQQRQNGTTAQTCPDQNQTLSPLYHPAQDPTTETPRPRARPTAPAERRQTCTHAHSCSPPPTRSPQTTTPSCCTPPQTRSRTPHQQTYCQSG